jgi:hypothetical protein
MKRNDIEQPEPPEVYCCRAVGAPKDSSPAARHHRGRTFYKDPDRDGFLFRIKRRDSVLESHWIVPIIFFLLINQIKNIRT